MYRSRLMVIFSLINFIAVFVCICLLPSNVAFQFDSNFIITTTISKWCDIIIPFLQLLSCIIIVMIDFKEDNKIPHIYRYIITYVAISIATYYTWIMLAIQFENLQIGDMIIAPISILILVPIALFMMAYGYAQSAKKFNTSSIFGLKFVKEHPVLWQKTHKLAGFMSSFCGMVIIILAILNETIFKTNWIYLIAFIVWFVLYYLVTLIYAYRESKFYQK